MMYYQPSYTMPIWQYQPYPYPIWQVPYYHMPQPYWWPYPQFYSGGAGGYGWSVFSS